MFIVIVGNQTPIGLNFWDPNPNPMVPQEAIQMWEFPKIRGTLFWGPYDKDPTISGTILGSPIFGNSHVVDRLQSFPPALPPPLEAPAAEPGLPPPLGPPW